MFDHVESALHYAYRVSARDVISLNAPSLDLRGATVRLSGGTDPWDHHAQAGLILSMLNALPAQHRTTIKAAYAVRPGEAESASFTLSISLTQRLCIGHKLAIATVRDWRGTHPIPERLTARENGISRRQVRRARNGARDLLSNWLTLGTYQAEGMMIERGLIDGPP